MLMIHLVCVCVIIAFEVALFSLYQSADVDVGLRSPNPLVQEDIFSLGIGYSVPAQPEPASCYTIVSVCPAESQTAKSTSYMLNFCCTAFLCCYITFGIGNP